MIDDIKVTTKHGDVYHYNNQAEARKAARIASGLTQKAVADAIGTNVETYQKYEYGTRTPKEDTLESIARAVDVRVEVLWCTE
jgi:transcriptional regulator with XRE-family HTH domain